MREPTPFEVTCDICGGTGLGSIRTTGASWDTNKQIVHNNPEVCRDVLARKAEALNKKEKELE